MAIKDALKRQKFQKSYNKLPELLLRIDHKINKIRR